MSNSAVARNGLSVCGLELERGERLLFRGLAFEAPPGTLVRLAGANGTGKTSLLRLLTGLMVPDAGEILYKGESITKLREDSQINEALGAVGLTDFTEHTTGELSQGQRRRVALARLFVSEMKPVWILDEPFTALDVQSVANLSDAVARHVRAGGIVIYTTHQECAVDVPEEKKLTVDVSDFAPKRKKKAQACLGGGDHV